MEKKLIEILENNFKGQNIDKACKEICFLFKVKRSDDPVCPDCGKDELSCLGKYMDAEGRDGVEYGCDNCHCEFDFDNYA
jgi:hypothetical protein